MISSLIFHVLVLNVRTKVVPKMDPVQADMVSAVPVSNNDSNFLHY